MMSRLYADRQSQLDRAGIWISQGVWSQVEREWAQRADKEVENLRAPILSA